MSGSSSSSDSSTSDEAASDPPSEEEQAATPAPAKDSAIGAPAKVKSSPPAQPRSHKTSKKEKKEKKRHRDANDANELPFLPSIDTLQGRWRHSVNTLGMLSVKGNEVSFSDGTRYVLTEISAGRVDMDGWQTVASKSTPEVIVWMLGGDPNTAVNWLLEEDADEHALEGIDSRNIIQGKRRRAKVDYAALEKQIDEEEKQYQDVFSDASSSSEGRKAPRPAQPRAPAESVEMTPKEWAEHHAKQSKKAASLFRQWMVSTCTSRHEEILRRKGKLQTRLPVILIGPGRRLLEQELLPYAVKLRFQAQETVAVVDANCRRKFQERHAAEWAASMERFKDLEKRQALEKRRAREEAALAAPAAKRPAPTAPAQQEQAAAPAIDAPSEAVSTPAEAAEAQAPSPAKRPKRLRRVITSDDEEEAGESGACAGTVGASTEAESPSSILQAKQTLDASPGPEEVLNVLTYLETQNVDHDVLVSTKIGLTVNNLRRTYAQHPDVAQRAAALVKRWREMWEQYQSQKRAGAK